MKVSNGSYLVVEGEFFTFFEEDDDPTFATRKWLNEGFENSTTATPLPFYAMEDVSFGALELVPGKKYLYCHNASCMHAMSIEDCWIPDTKERQTQAKLVNETEPYKLTVRERTAGTRNDQVEVDGTCQICNFKPPTVRQEQNKFAMTDPCLLCDTCACKLKDVTKDTTDYRGVPERVRVRKNKEGADQSTAYHQEEEIYEPPLVTNKIQNNLILPNDKAECLQLIENEIFSMSNVSVAEP